MRSALVITVPDAEGLVGPFRARHDWSAAAGVPAHITVLFPFVPSPAVDAALCEDLAAHFAAFAPFRFTLRDLRRFPTTLYLAPDPDDGFRALTLATVERYPQYPPYGGAYPDVVPHLTVAQGDALDEIERDVRAAASGVLQIEADASAVTLMLEGDDGRWRSRQTFRLGPHPTSAAGSGR